MSMGRQALGYGAKFLTISNGAAAGTSLVTSSTFDSANYEDVLIMAKIGTITGSGTATVQVQQGDESNGSDAADITGASAVATGSADSDQLVIVDVYKPMKRYITVTVTRATANSEVDGIFAVLKNARSMPVSQDATHVAGITVLVPTA